MKKLNLIIADYNEEYLSRLYSYILSEHKTSFEINCFSDKELLIESIKQIKDKSNLVLVIDNKLYDLSLENMGISTIISLVDYEIDDSEIKKIHKYRDVGCFKDKVIRAYSECNPENIIEIQSNNAETKIIAVYSPVGGCGKSTISAALSCELVERGNEVFYLNLEDIQSTDLYFNGENNKNLSDVILEVKDRDNNFVSKLLESINVDKETGVAYLNPTESIFDIEDMSEEDAKWIIEGLCEEGKYNYIIIDMSAKFNSLYNMILKSDLTKNIICPVINDKTSLNKLNKFISNISSGHINSIEKYFFLYNIDNGVYGYENSNNDNVEFKISIREIKELRKASGKDVINSSFIKTYMNQIIKCLDL